MKTYRLAAALAAAVLAAVGGLPHITLAAPPHYSIRAAQAYCNGGGTACSLTSGDYYRGVLNANGPPTGVHSSTPVNLVAGCYHAYPKGSDRLLDWGLLHEVSPHIFGVASVPGPGLNNNVPNKMHLAIDDNGTFKVFGQTYTDELQARTGTNSANFVRITNGPAGNEAAERLLTGTVTVILKGALHESYGFQNGRFTKSKITQGEVICNLSASGAHLPLPYDWDAEMVP